MGQGFGQDKIEERHSKLEQKKDLLVRLGEVIEWERFRATLTQVEEKPRKSKAGRKRHDGVLMFKMLILQQLYKLRELGLIDQLFEQFDGYLRTHGYQAKGGQIVDATLILVPTQPKRRH
jgi:hypothetical protein